MIALGRAAGLALALLASEPVMARQASVLEFSELKGWAGDNHAAALRVFRSTCGLMEGGDWRTLCALAGRVKNGEMRRGPFLSSSSFIDSMSGRPPIPEPKLMPTRSALLSSMARPVSRHACRPAAMP